jgi:16S rRNA C967 or C1407 C5-methylase (RsmB/RsmF family)
MEVEVLDLTEFMNAKYFKGKLPGNRKTVQLFTHRDGTDSMFLALLTKPVRQ